jgi:imidazolonepropionase
VQEIRVDADGGVVMPGMIDSHTHLVHGEYKKDKFGKPDFAPIMRATQRAHFDVLFEQASERADEVLRHGVTTIEVKSGYGYTAESEVKLLNVVQALGDNHPLRFIPTLFAGRVLSQSRSARVRDFTQTIIPAVQADHLARFFDVCVDEHAFRRDEARQMIMAAHKRGILTKLHADQFSDRGGAQLAAEVGAISVDHLEYISDTGIKALAKSGTVAVILPGTTFFTSATRYAPARKMIQAGVRVAIATNYNPDTTPCLDLFLMATIAITQMGLTPEDALLGVTLNAARAIAADHDIGSITVGKRADLVVLGVDHEIVPLYRYGASFLRTVICEGEVVWRHHGYNL